MSSERAMAARRGLRRGFAVLGLLVGTWTAGDAGAQLGVDVEDVVPAPPPCLCQDRSKLRRMLEEVLVAQAAAVPLLPAEGPAEAVTQQQYDAIRGAVSAAVAGARYVEPPTGLSDNGIDVLDAGCRAQTPSNAGSCLGDVLSRRARVHEASCSRYSGLGLRSPYPLFLAPRTYVGALLQGYEDEARFLQAELRRLGTAPCAAAPAEPARPPRADLGRVRELAEDSLLLELTIER